MVEILHELGNSPLLAALGLVTLLALVVAPIVLRMAGLTGAQIVQLLSATMNFLIELVRQFRQENNGK